MVLESAPTTRLVMCARCCIVACIPNWGVLSRYVCGPCLSRNNCKAHRSAQSAQTVIDFLDWTGHHRRSNPHPLFVQNILGGDFFTHPVFFLATRCYRIHSLAILRRLGLMDPACPLVSGDSRSRIWWSYCLQRAEFIGPVCPLTRAISMAKSVPAMFYLCGCVCVPGLDRFRMFDSRCRRGLLVCPVLALLLFFGSSFQSVTKLMILVLLACISICSTHHRMD
jgi:hypothetical protein